MDIKDEQLIKNIRTDDYVSYNYLFLRYYSRLCLFVDAFTNNHSDSEDIVQELFIKLWTNRKKTEIQSTLSSYLYQSAKNMALNYIRSESNRRTIIDKIQNAAPYLNDSDTENIDFSLKLEDCINQLPARCKEVLLMQHIQNYKQKEIAEKFNTSLKTVKNQIWVALQRLRICLELKKNMSI